MKNQINSNFEWSPWWWFLFVGAGVSFLVIAGFTSFVSSNFWRGMAQGGFFGVLIIHISEGIYGYFTAKKNNLPAFPWALHCFLAGAMAIILMKKYLKQK